MIRSFLYNLDPIKFIVSDMKFSIYILKYVLWWLSSWISDPHKNIT